MKLAKLVLALVLAASPAFAAGYFGGGGGGTATSITSGTTTITSGVDTSPCFDDGGVINCSDTGWSFNKTTNALTATTFIGALTGNASTATALAANPVDCGGGQFAISIAANGDLTCATPSGTISGLTTGLVPQAASSTTLTDSSSYRISVTNDTVTGTTTNKLVKLTSAGRAIVTGAAETSGVLGVCTSGCGTSGSAIVALIGSATCAFTNATTAGNYAVVSATVAGECQDSGSTTFPSAGTQVLGVITETGVAGNRTTFLATPDVASVSQGGGGGGNKNPAGAAGDVQYRATNNNFDAEADFNYVEGSASALTIGSAAPQVIIRGDALTGSQNQLDVIAGTLAASTNLALNVSATLPTVPAGTASGAVLLFTSAGSEAQDQIGVQNVLGAGYTGANLTRAVSNANVALGTGTSLGLGIETGPVANVGTYSSANGVGTGYRIGSSSNSSGGTGLNIGSYGFATDNVAATQIGVLGHAALSTEGTNLKNVAGWFTLDTTDPATIADNVSITLVAASDGTADIFRGYKTTTKKYAINANGIVTIGGDWLIDTRAKALDPCAAENATQDTRNNHPVLDYEDGTTSTRECGCFENTLPPTYAGNGLTVTLDWMAATATTGNVVWEGYVERQDTSTDLDADSFAAAQTVTAAAPGTSGALAYSNITFTSGGQMDSLVAGERFRFKVCRDADNASDTMTGDGQLAQVLIRETP